MNVEDPRKPIADKIKLAEDKLKELEARNAIIVNVITELKSTLNELKNYHNSITSN